MNKQERKMLKPEQYRILADMLDETQPTSVGTIAAAEMIHALADEVERLEGVIHAYDNLAACYRLRRQPSESTLDAIRDYRESLEEK